MHLVFHYYCLYSLPLCEMGLYEDVVYVTPIDLYWNHDLPEGEVKDQLSRCTRLLSSPTKGLHEPQEYQSQKI